MLGGLWEPGVPRHGGHRSARPPQPCSETSLPHGLSLGNSSQVSDGAAAILLARRSKAEELGLPILGILRSYAVVGVPPDIMGIGPAVAIPVALQKAGKAASSYPRPGSRFCLSCYCWRVVVLWVLPSEGGTD